MRLRRLAAALAACFAFPATAFAQTEPAANSGDTAWILTASALVLMMTIPGLGLFYGGLVRARNVLSVVMHSFVILCTVSLLWVVGGYSMVFGPGSPYLGGLDHLMLANLSDLRSGLTIPESSFALFQMTFAVITPALVIGAFVERVRFGWVVAFSTLWTLLVYIPVARWVWGGGWLASDVGTLDFAGGIVVHTTAGVAALIVAALLGPRKGFNKSLLTPHSPALTMVGAGLLWVGWFGFNGGSALAAGDGAATAILNTHLAASTAALVWILIERIRIGKATSIGIVTGAIAGLATVTPAAGYIGPAGAIVLGALGGAICFAMVQVVKHKWQIDDSLDVFAVHGVGGILGSLLMPLFFSEMFGGGGFAAGASMTSQFSAQAIGLAVVAIWTAAMTVIAAWTVSVVLPMRVDEEAEHDGLDLHSHGERGWELD
jgi:ammonium transporter, Amt family